MGVASNRPVTVLQLVAALDVLGSTASVDPQRRPHGAGEDDALELTGALLAVAELEATARLNPAALEPQGLADLQRGWHAQTPTLELRRAVLVRRLQRTAYDISRYLDTAKTPGQPRADDRHIGLGPTAAAGYALAAANLLVAQHQADQGDYDSARQALDSAAELNAQAQTAAGLLRQRMDAGPT
ncbi:hypothetical protein [Streptomyces sp. NPDC046939]|uniref:hypothetical protein n=1 Tax=Streptomyces sp. NPDC046939 TaxID=3155376 RepID=UPI0033F34D2D